MSAKAVTEPITIEAAKGVLSEIDALAAATERSRSDIVNEALRHYVDATVWQTERIREGIAAARAGRIRPADEVFDEIANERGWKRLLWGHMCGRPVESKG